MEYLNWISANPVLAVILLIIVVLGLRGLFSGKSCNCHEDRD